MKFFKEHKAGIIGTILFNLILLVILMLFGFSISLPLPEEEGILVNFGYEDIGSGFIEPENNTEIDNNQPVPEESYSTPSESNEETKMTQDFENAPVIKKTSQKKHKKTQEEKEREKREKEQKELEESLANTFNNSSSSNNSASQGDNGRKGNQGSPNGSTNTRSNGVGSRGISYSLSGRKANSLPKPKYTTNEGGVVVVEIMVKPDGTVASATPGMPGSTTNNPTLLQAAKNAALKTKFTKKSGPQVKQIGTITYRFVLR